MSGAFEQALHRGSAPTGRPLGRHPEDWRIEALWDRGLEPGDAKVRGGRLPGELAARFGADLAIPLAHDRPTIVADFVSTLDGIVALDRTGATGGREISGGSEADRFLMGLLRGAADAVLVGAGTVRASRTRSWTPGRVHPPSAAGYARWRRELGLAVAPPAIVVTASGQLGPDPAWLAAADQPVIIATTEDGAARLRDVRRDGRVEVVALAPGGRVPIQALLELLDRRAFALVVSEAGPTLFGELLEARVVDELFLTLAPQLAGRAQGVSRLGLVEGVGFPQAVAPWADLRSVMRSADHLFLRYRLASSQGWKGALA